MALVPCKPSALWVVRRPGIFGVTHVAIAELGIDFGYDSESQPQGLVLEFASGTGRSVSDFDPTRWTVVRRIADQGNARKRVLIFMAGTTLYSLPGFNCEHAVSYIEFGKPESPQVQSAVFAFAAIIGFAALMGSRPKAA